jgi:hypothetical protein
VDISLAIALTEYFMGSLWAFVIVGFVLWIRSELRQRRPAVPVDGTVADPAERLTPPEDPPFALPILAERTRRRAAARSGLDVSGP